ncbi:DUF512 domain-containing protein [Desulfallas sp. Bu1-1]|nr:DUF512 domain-containing protein [Desulfallas sp. Bu1-1]
MRMQNFVESLIYWSAGHGNILPLTSRCNVSCIFCSNRLNPEGVEVFNIKPRTPDQVRQTVEFLDPLRPVVIGESVTRINEGEPFSHPQIEEILISIRKALPRTPIRITTNGSLLDHRRVSLLQSLAPVTVYLSLNSANAAVRRQIMSDSRASYAVSAASLLGRHGFDWHGSVVAMPHLTGWDDLRDTILYLARCNAKTIRVFWPGYTCLAPPELRFPSSMPESLRDFIGEIKVSTPVPVTMEPPLINDLRSEVAGVIKGSPAHRAGVRQGDIIRAVNGAAPFSRVHAYQLTRNTADPQLTITSSGAVTKTVLLRKKARESSGLVMEYDIDPSTVRQIERAVTVSGANRVLLLTSVLARNIINNALLRLKSRHFVTVIPVSNKLFGGSINTAGLLVVDDMVAAMQDFFAQFHRPDLVLLPRAPFDHRGRDLTGKSWREIEQHLGLPVQVI